MKATVTHYENTRVRKAISDCHWQQFSICSLQPLYYYCSGNLTTKSATHIPMCKLHFQKTFQTLTKASCDKDFKTSLHKWTNTMTHTQRHGWKTVWLPVFLISWRWSAVYQIWPACEFVAPIPTVVQITYSNHSVYHTHKLTFTHKKWKDDLWDSGLAICCFVFCMEAKNKHMWYKTRWVKKIWLTPFWDTYFQYLFRPQGGVHVFPTSLYGV